MTRSRTSAWSTSFRRRTVAAAFAAAIPLTMAVSCGEEPVVGEQEEGEEQNLEQEDEQDDEEDDD